MSNAQYRTPKCAAGFKVHGSRPLHAHLLLHKPLYHISHPQAKAAKPEHDEEYILLEGTRCQVKKDTRAIPYQTNGSRPEESGSQAIAEVVQDLDIAHTDHQWQENPETVEEPVTEKDWQAVGGEKVLCRLELCLKFGTSPEKVFAVHTTDSEVKPVADKWTKKGENDRVGAFEEATVHQR